MAEVRARRGRTGLDARQVPRAHLGGALRLGAAELLGPHAQRHRALRQLLLLVLQRLPRRVQPLRLARLAHARLLGQPPLLAHRELAPAPQPATRLARAARRRARPAAARLAAAGEQASPSRQRRDRRRLASAASVGEDRCGAANLLDALAGSQRGNAEGLALGSLLALSCLHLAQLPPCHCHRRVESRLLRLKPRFLGCCFLGCGRVCSSRLLALGTLTGTRLLSKALHCIRRSCWLVVALVLVLILVRPLVLILVGLLFGLLLF